ncbi:MAG: hypothetical protein GX811_04860 [Lentisphaerae bacterium]|nr:hypothetical protein [Lentisphaerota bacterium]
MKRFVSPAFLLAQGIAIFLFLTGCTPPPSSGEDMPALSSDILADALKDGEKFMFHLTWLVILLSALMQLLAFAMARRKLNDVKASYIPAKNKLDQLEVIGVYFDLPLYFGLLGTVMSFIIITIYPDAGLMFAYTSTAMGIIVSVFLHLVYLVPFKEKLLSEEQ